MGVLTCVLLNQGTAIAGPYLIGGQNYTEVGPTETLGATFTAADGGSSTGAYSGFVLLTVSGFGQSLGTQLNDAFYLYTDGAGNPIAPFHDASYYQVNFASTPLVPLDPTRNATNFIVFDVDAGTEVAPGYVPTYRGDHTYAFIVNTALVNPSTLHFGTSNGVFFDNTGSYSIEITQLQAPEPATILLMGLGLAAGVRRMRRGR
jgi:hypothetical protein